MEPRHTSQKNILVTKRSRWACWWEVCLWKASRFSLVLAQLNCWD